MADNLNHNSEDLGILISDLREVLASYKVNIGKLEKGQKVDEGRFFRVTGADREEADNVQHKHGNGGNSDGDPAENGNDAEEHGKCQNDLDLQRLLYMERGIG